MSLVDERVKMKRLYTVLNTLHRFTVLDLLLATALIAMNVSALHTQARNVESVWALIVYLSPTLITCWIHLRLRLTIPVAGATHYVLTVAWTFLHAAAVNIALNAANASSPSSRRLLIFSNAWNDTVEILGWGIVLAATYVAICYTAVAASANTNAAPNCHA